MSTKIKPWLIYQLVFLLFVFSYANQLIYRYEVPAGGDAINHNFVVLNILKGDYAQIYQYHTVWHLVVGSISLLLHARSITVMAWLAPALLVSMGVTLYYFNRRYFGPIAGITSLILMGFFSKQPLQTLYDGGFPSVLAVGTVLPILFILTDNLYTAKKPRRAMAWFLIGVIVLAFSHHLTTIYTIPILAMFFFLEILHNWRKKHGSPVITIFTILATFVALIGILGWFLNSSLDGGSIKVLANQFVAIDFSFPFVHLLGRLDNPNAIWQLTDYPDAMGEAVFYLGIFGLGLALFNRLFRSDRPERRIYTLLILWTSFLFVGSQIPALGFPVRLARDLAVPLTLLAGLFVQTIIDFIRDRQMPGYLVTLFLIACLALAYRAGAYRIAKAVTPNPLINHLTVDTKAARYITQNIPLSSRVAVFQNDIYLDFFTPLHDAVKVNESDRIKKMTDAQHAPETLDSFAYVYVEQRLDQDESWINNRGIVESYLNSPYVNLVATFKQKEKSVFIFKAVPSQSKTADVKTPPTSTLPELPAP